jgi:hypothetical protein
MVTGGELRNHPAVGLVHGDLGMHRLGEQPAVVKGDAGFVTRSLDAEDEHEGILIQFAPLFVTQRRS